MSDAVVFIPLTKGYVSRFKTAKEAAHAYDAAALKHFGEFAKVNFSTPEGKE